MSEQKRDSGVLLAWLLIGTFMLVCSIAAAGISQKRMDLTAVALSLVAFMGVIVRELIGRKGDDDT